MKNRIYGVLCLFTGLLLASCLKKDINYSAGTPSPFIIIEDVKALYHGSPVVLNADNLVGASSITGIVISDAASGNIRKGTVVIQQTKRNFTRGITLDLGSGTTIPYQIGDSLIISVNGATLNNYKGTLQITGLSLGNVTKAGSNMEVTPVVTSLASLDSNFKDLESVLVQVTGVSIDPTPTGTETYSGDRALTDASGGNAILHTEAGAAFSAGKLPVNATFTGIATWYNAGANSNDNAAKQIWLRNTNDVQHASGSLYFLESFENGVPLKANYTAGSSTFPTSGTWYLDNAGVNSTANDAPVSGIYSVRLNKDLSVPALIEMRFDLPDGASKVSVWHSSYAASADAPSTWKLEYSTNGGTTWIKTGDSVRSVIKTKALATFTMDIHGPVRFRINKLGLGSGTLDPTIENGRLSIDDLSIYRNP